MSSLIQVCLFIIISRRLVSVVKTLIQFFYIEPYNIGRKSQERCEYEFHSSSIESGVFMSPTYPGTYPNILNCSYKFIGQPNERIEIYFEEILLHYGADQ
jgi:hypothetical protein